jgi:hypothetical protein
MAVGMSAGIGSQVVASTSSSAAIRLAKAVARSTQRAAARVEAVRAEGEVRDRIMKRVDELVKGMETLAHRMSAEGVSTTRRSVLVSRFNELQRQVNRIDGIVGGEGREASGQQAVAAAGAGTGAAVGNTSTGEVKALRQRLEVSRQTQADGSGEAAPRRPVENAGQAWVTGLGEVSLSGGKVDLEV